MKDFLRLAEKGFIIFSLLYFTSSLDFLARGLQPPVDQSLEATGVPIENSYESSSVLLALQALVLGITLFLACKRWQSIVYVARRKKLFWVFVGIFMTSSLWSDIPNFTFRRSIILLGATLFGLYLSACYSIREQMRFLASATGIAALLCVFITLAFPSIGIESGEHAGALRGIYIQKNSLSEVMALSSLVFLLVALDSRRYRKLVWAGFGLSVMLLLLSTSKTGLVVFLLLMLLLPLVRALRWNHTIVVPFFITLLLVGGGVAILLVGNAETILNALGRDVTLTGRTGIWNIVIEKILKRPWLGYGYMGFWRGMEGESADVWYDTYFMAPHAHNTYLDLALQFGFVGLLVFMLSFLVNYLRAIAWVRLNPTTEGLWPIMFLNLTLLYSTTETIFVSPTSPWVLYTALTTSMLVQPIKIGSSKPFDIAGGFNQIRKTHSL